MLRIMTCGIAALLVCAAATSLPAKEWTDYSYDSGFWEVNAIEVDPNHIDDYLTGLKSSQVSALEIMKARGLIDDYRFLVRQGYVKGGPTVLIMLHIPNVAALVPDKARDQALEKEIYAKFSEEAGKKIVAEYEKYRTFIDNAYWREAKFAK